MRILQVSKFAHHVGGVETYLGWLTRALTAAGHRVGVLAMTPPDDRPLMDLAGSPTWLTRTRSFEAGAPGRLRAAAMSVWSPEAGVTMSRAIEEHEPDVVHFHGTCYQLTSSVVRAAARAGIPAVLTAHEYKLICANQTFYSDPDGKVCTDCLGAGRVRRAVSPLSRRCMKGSLAVSALGSLEQAISVPVWRRAPPTILAPSQFMRRQLIDDGWPRETVGYLDLPWRRADEWVLPARGHRDRIVFASRLVPLKGPETLLKAWQRIAVDHPGVSLEIIGDGTQANELHSLVRDRAIPRVDFTGWVDASRLRSALDRAVVTTHPSRCHENSPFAVRESLMAGVPALVSSLGGMPEMVSEATGWTVPPDDVDAWAQGLERAIRSGLAGSAGLTAAVEERSFTEEDHLSDLLTVYANLVSRADVRP